MRGHFLRTAHDADALKYSLNVQTADAQPLEADVHWAKNQFVLYTKADGNWNAIKASCILAGARTLAGALVPLAGTAPTNFNFDSGDYNRKTGLLGNGATKYLNSNRNNNADPRDSNHNAVYVSTSFSNVYIGSDTTGPGSNALGQNLNRNRNLITSPPSFLTGFSGNSRSAGNQYISRTANANTIISVPSLSPNLGSLYIFARHTAGIPNTFTASRIAFYSIGESLGLALLGTRVTALINAYAAVIP